MTQPRINPDGPLKGKVALVTGASRGIGAAIAARLLMEGARVAVSARTEGPGESKLPGGPLEMVYIRAPRIASVGPGVEVMAERDGFPVLVRQGRLLAATFHPELSSDRRVHQLFVDIVREQRDRPQ